MSLKKKNNTPIRLLLFFLSIFASESFAANVPVKSTTDIGGKYKSSGPIEITSDSLEVLQQNHKAIFTGHVVAVQGDVHIKSEKMTVFYKSTESEKTAKPEKTITSAVSDKNSIEKIVVEKNVFLTTPEETASGERGLYDVVNHKIFLNDNVILTRDKNVLKGDRLVYDFATGKSELNSPEAGTDSNSGKPKQRVKALFIPDNNKKPTVKK